MDLLSYAMGKAAGGGGGGGGSVTVEPLTVTENGTYTAPSGKAYSPVTVDVSGGADEAEDMDVNLYDLDGRRLYSYTKAEAAALTELPDAPDVPELNLAFGGWNWTLAEINAQPGYVEVGACYEPTDCDCALVIEPTLKSQLSVTVRFSIASGSSVSADWGDGSDAGEYSGGSSQIVATHEYAECRRYRIRLTRDGTAKLILGGAANTNLLYGVHGNYLSQEPLAEAYVGSGCEMPAVTTASAALRKIVFGSDAKLNTAKLHYLGRCFIFPRNSNYARDFSNTSIYSLTKMIPAGTTFLPIETANGFRYVGGDKLTIPHGATKIAGRAMMDQGSIRTIHIPATVTSIAAQGIAWANDAAAGIREVWFHGTTPPALAASNSISLYSLTKVLVPFAALAAYLTGTNYPDPATYAYFGFATLASGAALPTQDGTGAYSVTWYATKEDAAAEINPITEGNGAEIYCNWEAAT